MAAASFTHDGFFKQFGSKSDLIAEAAMYGLTQSAAQSKGAELSEFIEHYVSRNHRDAPGRGCTMAALCADAARQSQRVKESFAAGIESQLAATESNAGSNEESEREVRIRKINAMAHAVGAIVLSRACPDESPLAQEILSACRKTILASLKPASLRSRVVPTAKSNTSAAAADWARILDEINDSVAITWRDDDGQPF